MACADRVGIVLSAAARAIIIDLGGVGNGSFDLKQN